MNVVAQIFGFIALIIYCTSLQYKKKKNIVKFQILSNLFYSLQYLMLNAYSGIYVSLIGMSRSIILYKYEENKKKSPLFILFVIIILSIYSGVLGYSGIVSLIPILICISFSVLIWQKELTIFRYFCVLFPIGWICYNLCVGAYISIISSIIELICALVALIKLDILKKK